MSTSAESARQWLQNTQPNDQLLAETIGKLELRIAQHADQQQKIAGSLAALDVLEQEQLDRQLKIASDSQASQHSQPLNLDLGELGQPSHDLQAPPLDEQEKKQRFVQLKQQFGQL